MRASDLGMQQSLTQNSDSQVHGTDFFLEPSHGSCDGAQRRGIGELLVTIVHLSLDHLDLVTLGLQLTGVLGDGRLELVVILKHTAYMNQDLEYTRKYSHIFKYRSDNIYIL